jgi:flavin reductase (DIM6/NTAB) family NADH-FMN oxidoreductase RutF
MHAPHISAEPAILYFGTPVVLVSTLNADGSANLAPMSSVFWLGWRAMLGLGASSQTAKNLIRTRECVLNLPSSDQTEAVNGLAFTTGAADMPPTKQARGYKYQPNKFGAAGLTPLASETVAPPRAHECPVHLEAVLESQHGIAAEDPALAGKTIAFEVRIQRVHLHPSILRDGMDNHVDPARWRPLIMSFQKLYGLSTQEAAPSRLAQIPEALYRSPDVDRARAALNAA